MALINCPECKNEVSELVGKCPHCGFPLKKKTKRPLFIGIGCVAIALVVFVVLYVVISNNNNNYKKAKKAFLENDYEAYKQLNLEVDEKEDFKNYLENKLDSILNEYSEGEKTFDDTVSTLYNIENYVEEYKLEEYEDVAKSILDSEMDKIYEKYIKAEISGEEALEELKKVKESISVADEDKYKSTYTKINKLIQSKKNYEDAIEFENKGEYIKACSLYNQVLKDDPNHDTAVEKIDELKPLIASEYCEEAKEYLKNENYSSALSSIKSAIEYNDTNEYQSLKDEITAKKEEYDTLIEEQKRQEKLLSEGKIIQTDKIEATFISAKLTDKLLPDTTSGYYGYYTPNDNSIFLDIKFKVKNIGVTSKDLDSIVGACKVTYDGAYTYSKHGEYYSEGNHIDPVYSWDDIDPLEELTFHLVFELPLEVYTSDKSVVANFTIDGKEQQLEYR